jgi:glycine hydroxymethyltransferase
LRGPRAGLVFFRKDSVQASDLEKRVNDAVFPACQGGPHNNVGASSCALYLPLILISQTIAAVATALHQACQPTWKAYAKQVIANARTLAAELVAHGYKLQTNGSDNHLVLWDLRPLKLTGSKLEKLCDLLGITINSMFLTPNKSDIGFLIPNYRKRCIRGRLGTSTRRYPPWNIRDNLS